MEKSKNINLRVSPTFIKRVNAVWTAIGKHKSVSDYLRERLEKAVEADEKKHKLS